MSEIRAIVCKNHTKRPIRPFKPYDQYQLSVVQGSGLDIKELGIAKGETEIKFISAITALKEKMETIPKPRNGVRLSQSLKQETTSGCGEISKELTEKINKILETVTANVV